MSPTSLRFGRGWTIFLVAIFFESCTIGLPWSQRVNIILRQSKGPLSQQHFKLVEMKGEEPCIAAGLQGTTDAKGVFDGRRWRWPSAIDIVDVRVTHDTICIPGAGAWRTVEIPPYGPAPAQLSLWCDVAQDPMEETSAHLRRYPCWLAASPPP